RRASGAAALPEITPSADSVHIARSISADILGRILASLLAAVWRSTCRNSRYRATSPVLLRDRFGRSTGCLVFGDARPQGNRARKNGRYGGNANCFRPNHLSAPFALA